jgi:hypothetical protein
MKIIKMDMKFKMIQKNQKRKIVIKRKMMIYKTKKQKDKKTLIKLRLERQQKGNSNCKLTKNMQAT